MSLVVWGLWVNTKSWDLSVNNISVLYTSDEKLILLDQFVLRKSTLDTLIQSHSLIKRIYLDYPYIYFINRDIDTPFFRYDINAKSIKYYNITGTFSDFTPNSKFLLASSNYLDSKSYDFKDSAFIQVYGYRVVDFLDKKLYIDKNYQLRDLETGQLIMDDVKNVSVSMNYLLVFTSNRLVLMDKNLKVVREIPSSFLDGFLIDIDDDGKDELIVYDYKSIYIYKDNDMEVVANLKDSINCVMILDYDEDGSYDLLVSTKKEVKLFEQMPRTNLELDRVNYSIINTKCGCLWGMQLVSQKPIREDPFSIKIKYKLDGIEFSVNNSQNEFVVINLLDAKGSFIKTIYSGRFKGVNSFNVSLEKTGVYLISIKGEINTQKFSFIWNKR